MDHLPNHYWQSQKPYYLFSFVLKNSRICEISHEYIWINRFRLFFVGRNSGTSIINHFFPTNAINWLFTIGPWICNYSPTRFLLFLPCEVMDIVLQRFHHVRENVYGLERFFIKKNRTTFTQVAWRFRNCVNFLIFSSKVRICLHNAHTYLRLFWKLWAQGRKL